MKRRLLSVSRTDCLFIAGKACKTDVLLPMLEFNNKRSDTHSYPLAKECAPDTGFRRDLLPTVPESRFEILPLR